MPLGQFGTNPAPQSAPLEQNTRGAPLLLEELDELLDDELDDPPDELLEDELDDVQTPLFKRTETWLLPQLATAISNFPSLLKSFAVIPV